MPKLTALDEMLAHQIPEVFPSVVTYHEHWRESYFFVLHPRSGSDGDLVILTMASYPAKGTLDSYQMGRISGSHVFALHERPYGDDPHSTTVGPVSISIERPFELVRLGVVGEAARPVLDLTFRSRTRPYAMRRGTIKAGHEIIWDQSQMIQSGSYEGWYQLPGGTRREVEGWWGQRDHSWGIRDHVRCPMWLWLAIQLEDGMIGAWHWELADGSRIFTDGCFSPSDGGEPVPVVDLRHEFCWLDADRHPTSYGRDGATVRGLSGGATLELASGETIEMEVDGTWAMPYGPRGGGQHFCTVALADGRTGNGVVEITGVHHHRYFPVARADRLPS